MLEARRIDKSLRNDPHGLTKTNNTMYLFFFFLSKNTLANCSIYFIDSFPNGTNHYFRLPHWVTLLFLFVLTSIQLGTFWNFSRCSACCISNDSSSFTVGYLEKRWNGSTHMCTNPSSKLHGHVKWCNWRNKIDF